GAGWMGRIGSRKKWRSDSHRRGRFRTGRTSCSTHSRSGFAIDPSERLFPGCPPAPDHAPASLLTALPMATPGLTFQTIAAVPAGQSGEFRIAKAGFPLYREYGISPSRMRDSADRADE